MHTYKYQVQNMKTKSFDMANIFQVKIICRSKCDYDFTSYVGPLFI